MINKESFRENFKYYDKSIVLQVIDIFLDEYPGRIRELEKNVSELDYPGIDNNAHSFKGAVAYMSPQVAELARKLEFMGKERSNAGILETLEKLRVNTRLLAQDLKDIRTEYL